MNEQQRAVVQQALEAFWVCAEHNALHFGQKHNTVVKANSAASTLRQLLEQPVVPSHTAEVQVETLRRAAMNTHPKSLLLADALESRYSGCHQDENDFLEMDAAAKLRRLHEENVRLKVARSAAWVGLTDDERNTMWFNSVHEANHSGSSPTACFARHIEAKLREKNGY